MAVSFEDAVERIELLRVGATKNLLDTGLNLTRGRFCFRVRCEHSPDLSLEHGVKCRTNRLQ